MLFQRQVIFLLAAQSASLLACAFVAPSPFGLTSSSTLQKCAGPLFSDVVSAVSSTSEDEAAESVVEETVEETTEPELSAATADTNDEPLAESATEEAVDEPAAESAPVEEKERMTVFLGNLPFQTTDSEVRDLFTEFGTVEYINVPRNRETGQARGFAFVDMSTREELEKAIEGVNGIMYGGRTLRAAESLPKDQVKKGEQRIFESSGSEEGTRKIYVGNIPFETVKDTLIEFFSQYGTVKDVYIPLDTASGRARGFAFVTMLEEDADKAIEETNGQTFMGRTLAVSVPLPRGQKAPSREADSRTKLYVGNLSFYTTLDTIQDLFSEFGTVHDCYLPEDRERGGSRGFAFVTMSNEDAARAIDETDGYELDGRIIRVNEAQPKGQQSRRDDFYDDEDGDEGEDDETEYDGSEY